jgi:A/G-specific adenine glycosylase
VAARWRRLPGQVEQVFTHFALSLVVYAGAYEGGAPDRHFWLMRDAVGEAGFSNVMRKAVAHAFETGFLVHAEAPS